MKISNFLKLVFTCAIGACFAPKTDPTETDKIKALQKKFAAEIAAREKDGLDTAGYATKRTWLGKRVLTDESKQRLNSKALAHQNNGAFYGNYATSSDHQTIIDYATNKMIVKDKKRGSMLKSAKKK
jgi:hypothetical protein